MGTVTGGSLQDSGHLCQDPQQQGGQGMDGPDVTLESGLHSLCAAQQHGQGAKRDVGLRMRIGPQEGAHTLCAPLEFFFAFLLHG